MPGLAAILGADDDEDSERVSCVVSILCLIIDIIIIINFIFSYVLYYKQLQLSRSLFFNFSTSHASVAWSVLRITTLRLQKLHSDLVGMSGMFSVKTLFWQMRLALLDFLKKFSLVTVKMALFPLL